RPTPGRYPTHACAPISPLFDQVGPHARSVADLLLFDAALGGGQATASTKLLKGVRLGVIRSFWFSGLDAETERVTNAALARLTAFGVELVEGELPELKRLIELTTDPVQNHDVKPALPRSCSRQRCFLPRKSARKTWKWRCGDGGCPSMRPWPATSPQAAPQDSRASCCPPD